MKKRFFILIIVIVSTLCACGLADGVQNYIFSKEKNINVHFIDVGQGDCTFIELPDDKSMIIDAGNPSDGKMITQYISNLNYKSIDYVIATHPHSDHIGGMAEVLKNFDIGDMYMPDAENTSVVFEELIDVIKEKNISLHKAESGVKITDSNGIKSYILSPLHENYTDLNNYSAVVKIEYGETSFLFTGDAEAEVEKELINSNIKSTVLKVGHHGSRYSSSDEFIKNAAPSYAVISCGEGNIYDHPNDEVLEILKKHKVKIYRTDESGTIVISADSKGNITADKNESYTVNISDSQPADDENIFVYKTKTGRAYHRQDCSYVIKSMIKITLDEAQELKLSPCKYCKPAQ